MMNPLRSSVYLLIGELFIVLIIALASLILLAVSLAVYRRDLFPRFTLSILNLFYQPAKLLLGYFHINPVIVDDIEIELMNSVEREAYEEAPIGRRLLLLPQCLRNIECPAKTSPRDGIICEICGRCAIADLKEKCDREGVAICIAPGSEFVKRAIREREPAAALAVACQHDLCEVMKYVRSKGVPIIGVVLLRCGCVMTDVNWEEVEEKLFYRGSTPRPRSE